MSAWGKMRNVFLSDEELGKKDDDHNYSGLRQPSWHPAKVPQRRRLLKRIGLLLLLASLVYVFVKNIPVLGPNDRMRRPNYAYPDLAANIRKRPPYEQSPPSSPNTQSPATPERIFNGPVRFLELSASLHAISGTRGSMAANRNVLFVASSLKSASTLLPMACKMGVELKSYVHFALMSRSDIDLQDLRHVNGIDDSCQVIFHDARPDYALVSTDDRMEKAVFRAFHHIFMYMHPQAILVDGSDDEESFFLRGARQHVKVKKPTLIELPPNSAKRLDWLTKLDSTALRMWDEIHIDILIHATPGASGGLIRLLKSLSAADYPSSSVPHLTIELPRDIDPPTKQFLETFIWPPPHIYNPTNARYLSLRHRIPHQRMNEEESSARFLESFWPAQPQHSHILVLSPQAELSPQFFHYLKYSLLEYRYSAISTYQHWDRRLFGISLDQPLQLLDGKKALSLPSLLETTSSGEQTEGETSTSFLWQAPNPNAVLFLGEKWMELHDFVSRSLEAKQDLDPVPALLSEKDVSTQYPSWLEHALRLARARGYWTLYPGLDTARNLATIHSELHHMPEEYANLENSKSLLADDASDEEVENIRLKLRTGLEIPLSPVSLLESLPNAGNLRPFEDLPILTWDGEPTDVEELKSLAAAYTTSFKEEVGGCTTESSGKQKERENLSVQDLFCAAD
ncbi:hypothetical protein F5B20DRAFT_568613 [Whalleya microplaca]|nr:hypothetical protein F5B20DRAFT_568613 [Whalleya microplaca]